MQKYTKYQAKYFGEQINLKRANSSAEGIVSTMSGVKVDLNPHQVDAALFALKSPLQSGVILADEVGLGKTIEAAIVMAEYWSERKRKILLIVPASLRMQWRSELSEKFFIDSLIMESKVFNKALKEGKFNPFDKKDKVIICSYNFASRHDDSLKSIDWDLVVMDEAHKLRNTYKPNNVMGNKLKNALDGRKKLLLTATPLQNNLMELYGLSSIIDSHLFGDSKTFKEMYVDVENEDVRNYSLSQRLQPFCKRTLRSQVSEYVKYTSRIAILQGYEPSEAEETLYNGISDYLQTEELYAMPHGQRTLITLILRKLLASSSFAISGTLKSLIDRLTQMENDVETDIDISDYDNVFEYEDEFEENIEKDTLSNEEKKEDIRREIAILQELYDLAQSIKVNSKGENLLLALNKGFAKMEELKGERKAVIFTESKRTQKYLFNLLSNNGYEGKIVLLNGDNKDENSLRIYNEWLTRHKDDDVVSGSKDADMKAAVVEAFKNEASILIGTEAASEGINLQFCSIVVNYDLPWNPQRIEQRIGRCHRYGQKNDVVVINFLNEHNAADRRVYELLFNKFNLFSGVFGSSDEVLGSLESGVDFEKRIAGIYQKCKTVEEINREFDKLREELSDKINERMLSARESILKNLDEEVAKRLVDCQKKTVASLDNFSQWMYYFCLAYGKDNAVPLNNGRLRLKTNNKISNYNLQWKQAEEMGDIFLRKEDEFFQNWLEDALKQQVPPAHIRFYSSQSDRNIAFFAGHIGLVGTLSIDKVIYSGLDTVEYIIFTYETADGTELDDKLINNMFMFPADVINGNVTESETLKSKRKEFIELKKEEIETANEEYFWAECEKLDAYAEDIKEGLEREVKDMDKLINAKKKEINDSKGSKSLAELLQMRKEKDALVKKRKEMRRSIYDKQDEIDRQNERLREETRKKLEGKTETEHIMTISFEIA